MYIICEKSYIDRLGVKLDDQTNIGDSDSVDGLIKIFDTKRDLKIPKRTIYNAIKEGSAIKDKYYIYKIKVQDSKNDKL